MMRQVSLYSVNQMEFTDIFTLISIKILKRKTLSINLKAVGFNFNETVRPGDIIRMILGPTKDTATIFQSLLQNLECVHVNYDKTRLKVLYLNVFGVLTRADLDKTPNTFCLNLLKPSDVNQLTENFDVDVIVIDCLDSILWLCESHVELDETERIIREALVAWTKAGKILFIGSTNNYKVPLSTKLKIHI